MRQVDCRVGAPARGRRAFTLLEILLALALIALLAGVLVSGSVHLMGDKPVTAEDVFWQAVLQARQVALNHERDVRLSFDPKAKTFVVDDGTNPKILPVPQSHELTVDFMPGQAGGSTILVGGELVSTQAIPYVTFYADGTCTPFQVQFRNGGAARVVAIDPWTCALELPKLGGNP